MTLFEKGYMPLGGTDGKIPLEDYKDRTEFYKIDDVKRLKGYGGVLNNNLVQIDIDDTTEANIVYKIVCDMDLQCCVLKTSRGMHFYWTNTDLLKRKQNYSTAIGVKIDTGLGSQNAIIPLKVNGQIRTWLKEVDTLESIPSWLKPISKTSIDFKSMSEGDGRNAALFSYILTLQQASYPKNK
jgi:putative DNA primase/helicase